MNQYFFNNYEQIFPIFEKRHKRDRLTSKDELHGCSDFNQENEIAKNETKLMLYLNVQNKILIIEKQHVLLIKRKAVAECTTTKNGILESKNLSNCIICEINI